MTSQSSLSITVAGEPLLFLAARAIWWPVERSLILSDVHLGKAAHFRSAGVPLPASIADNDLRRLGELVATYEAERLIVVGDLTHAGLNSEWGRLKSWRAGYPRLTITLISGNHDLLSGTDYEDAGIENLSDALDIGPFSLAHKPGSGSTGRFEIAGHVHPAVRVRGRAKQRERVPCFVIGPRNIVMPAFGAFTGSYEIVPTGLERVLAIAGESIIELGRSRQATAAPA